MNNQKTGQTAHQKAKVEFRIHMINYLVINAILAIINLALSPEYIWFKWPLLGWGIGIALHALNAFYSRNTNIRERMVETEMKKENF